jgi:hypothetical protein
MERLKESRVLHEVIITDNGFSDTRGVYGYSFTERAGPRSQRYLRSPMTLGSTSGVTSGVQLEKDTFLTSLDSEELVKRGDTYCSLDYDE